MMNQALIPGDKITFSVGEILVGKKHSDLKLEAIDLKELPVINNFKANPDISGYGGMDLDSLEEDKIRLMEPDKESAVVLEKGVALTGYGILDNELHVQVRYADILETDNHGRIYLKNENGEAVYDQYSVSFRDDDGRDNYQEYVFPYLLMV